MCMEISENVRDCTLIRYVDIIRGFSCFSFMFTIILTCYHISYRFLYILI